MRGYGILAVEEHGMREDMGTGPDPVLIGLLILACVLALLAVCSFL